ncbi:MAG: prepilin-type N-terminal cleavage/methylation domain-containing protein [Bacteroidetes bacterium]|nr:MAG: prepilin-type N-terminal cleavage/methylation domain-containing protein [Bacteroidota bacterium]
MKHQKLKAFTLTELLIVLVIIGILMLLALPNLMPLISKTHSIEAQQALTTIQRLQKSYHQLHVKYTDDLLELGFEQEKTVLEGGPAKYIVEITNSGPTGFSAKATAVVDFDQDGNFNEWEITQEGVLRELVKD